MRKLKQVRRVALASLLGAALAASAAVPAFAASKPVAPSANALRTAGIKVALTVDGKPVVAGQAVKGREVVARITLPAKVKLAKPTAVSLVDYQTTTFNLAKSNQRFLQADSTRLLPGKTTVLELELKCGMKGPGRCAKLYKHQIDVVVGSTIIGADKPFKWLGSYPRYTGKQFLAGSFVKTRCLKGHVQPKCPTQHGRCKKRGS